MEFNVGDLLIEEPVDPMPPNWKPRIGLAMQRVPDRLLADHMALLIDGVITPVTPSHWKHAYPTEEKQWSSKLVTS
jgi:hypothetical protein